MSLSFLQQMKNAQKLATIVISLEITKVEKENIHLHNFQMPCFLALHCIKLIGYHVCSCADIRENSTLTPSSSFALTTSVFPYMDSTLWMCKMFDKQTHSDWLNKDPLWPFKGIISLVSFIEKYNFLYIPCHKSLLTASLNNRSF